MTTGVKLRTFEARDLNAVLRLNKESVHYLSPMDEDRLHTLLACDAQLTIAEYDGEVAGFLITFADGSDYDSVNYRWFARHLKDFTYIDRIVIDQAYRGKGIGQQFYASLKQTLEQTHKQTLEQTQNAGRSPCLWLAAEIDIEPRNDRSLAFHKQQGFAEVATQSAGQGKQVSLQVLSISGATNQRQ